MNRKQKILAIPITIGGVILLMTPVILGFKLIDILFGLTGLIVVAIPFCIFWMYLFYKGYISKYWDYIFTKTKIKPLT